CGQVPEPDFAVEVAGQEFLTVGAKGHAKGMSRLLQWLAGFFTIAVPEPDNSRSFRHPGFGREALAIVAEGHCTNHILVLQASTKRLTRGDRPKLCPFSLSLGADDPDQQPPIGAKGCCPDPAS